MSRRARPELLQNSYKRYSLVMQESFRSHPGVILQNLFKTNRKSLSWVMQVSIRTRLELLQNLFRRHSELSQTHSAHGICAELSQKSFRSRSELSFRMHSEHINSFRTHSELIQKTFKNHSRAIHESSRCLPGVLQH